MELMKNDGVSVGNYVYKEADQATSLPQMVGAAQRFQSVRIIAEKDRKGVRGVLYELLKKHNELIGISFTTTQGAIETLDAVFNQFGALSPTEIAYAFRWERSLPESEATPTYGKSLTGYYVTVLDKYRNARREVMRNQNLLPQINNGQDQVKTFSEVEKTQLLKNGVRESWAYFTENRTIETGRLWIYDALVEAGLTTWSDKDLEAVKGIAAERLKRKLSRDFSRQMVENAFGGTVKAECRRILLERYYADLQENGTDIYAKLYS